jgi:hypothetical protein
MAVDHATEQVPEQEAVEAPAAQAPGHAPAAAGFASAMGNHAFGTWANSLSRTPSGGVLARKDEEEEEEDDGPITLPGMNFAQAVIGGEFPKDGEVSKEVKGKLDKRWSWKTGVEVPLFLGVMAKFGIGVGMSFEMPNASIKMKGYQRKVGGLGKRQGVQVTGGTGAVKGMLAGSMTAGLALGVPGTNVGVNGQGTLALIADANASFKGDFYRNKPRGMTWGSWNGGLEFDADVKGKIIAAASGYFHYQVLWIFEDKFGHFKIGSWTLCDANLKVKGSLTPQEGLKVSIEPKMGDMFKPTGKSPEVRKRTEEEIRKAEELAGLGRGPVQQQLTRKVARAGADAPPPPADGGAGPPPDPGSGAGEQTAVARGGDGKQEQAPFSPQEINEAAGIIAPDEGEVVLAAGPDPEKDSQV